MGQMRNAYKILIRKSEGKREIGRCSGRWNDNNKIDLNE
jgi:hypothetical protein